MSDERLAAEFEDLRPQLERIAYSILGSAADAEDTVQEAWLRFLRRDDAEEIRDLRAWLSIAVGRLALDTLSSARARREEYVGPWLPEPLVTRIDVSDGGAAGATPEDPADRVTLDESISMALLIVLERLTPPERTAFLLHDVFGFTFEQAARATGRTPADARKLASRARRRVEDGRPRFPATRSKQLEVVAAFTTACLEGDLEALLALLDPDVVWRTDGGGKATAARQVHRGADRVARAMIALARNLSGTGYLADVNGMPGFVTEDDEGTIGVTSVTVDAGRIVAIDVVRNPEKLAKVPACEER